MLLYIKILKDFANQKQIDNVMVNFNRIFFISTFIIFFIHLLYISLTSALKAEMDYIMFSEKYKFFCLFSFIFVSISPPSAYSITIFKVFDDSSKKDSL